MTDIKFEDLIALPRPHIVVDFPYLDDHGQPVCQIALLTLNNTELMSARAEAQKKANKLLKDDLPNKGQFAPGYESIFEDALAVEILFRSCKSPMDLTKSFFPNPPSLSQLTNEQLGVLINHYNYLVATRGPIVSNMDEGEMDLLINRIAKDGKEGAFFLSSLTLEELKAFTTYAASLAALHLNSRTDNDSLGSQPDEQ